MDNNLPVTYSVWMEDRSDYYKDPPLTLGARGTFTTYEEAVDDAKKLVIKHIDSLIDDPARIWISPEPAGQHFDSSAFEEQLRATPPVKSQINNLELLTDYGHDGESVFDRFGAKKSDVVSNYQNVIEALLTNLKAETNNSLVPDLEQLKEGLKSIASNMESSNLEHPYFHMGRIFHAVKPDQNYVLEQCDIFSSCIDHTTVAYFECLEDAKTVANLLQKDTEYYNYYCIFNQNGEEIYDAKNNS